MNRYRKQTRNLQCIFHHFQLVNLHASFRCQGFHRLAYYIRLERYSINLRDFFNILGVCKF